MRLLVLLLLLLAGCETAGQPEQDPLVSEPVFHDYIDPCLYPEAYGWKGCE